jgi:FtsP/CotA-like multicopper oxidase with cupredoxin domain
MSLGNPAKSVRIAILALVGACAASLASAEIPGVPGTAFTLTAKADRISTPDGHSIYFWGFDSGGGQAQYPAPTLIVPAPGPVSITVVNSLPAQFNQRVSLAVAGLGVVATCAGTPALCVQGPITLEAATGGSVTYTVTASRPGTFLYNSASRPDLQVEMGLTGAMIVRPASNPTGQAYNDTAPLDETGNPAGSQYDHEYLFFLSEMDSEIHDLVEQQGVQAVDDSGRLSHYFPNYWFINGRNAPDTMAEAGVERLPTQPYNALPRTHPGDRVLMRVVGGGHDMHPFHHHGQHARVIAVDGFPLETGASTSGHTSFDLSHEVFTIPSLPGQTMDAILRWTGKGLGWDIYGASSNHPGNSCPISSTEDLNANGLLDHAVLVGNQLLDEDVNHNGQLDTVWGKILDAEGLDPDTHEYCADHHKPLPVVLPEALALANGPFYSGSPFLGQVGLMPPGDGGLNPNAGYTYMWHSHNEKEITNYDVFPGGMMTMLVVEPPVTPIP